jgi:plasmid maintenance system antidote protein VapI
MNIKLLIQSKNITVSMAARQIGISRQHLYAAINGKPIGRNAAKKIERWSCDAIKAVELMKI